MDNIFKSPCEGAVTNPLPSFNVESNFFQFALGFDLFRPFANTLRQARSHGVLVWQGSRWFGGNEYFVNLR